MPLDTTPPADDAGELLCSPSACLAEMHAVADALGVCRSAIRGGGYDGVWFLGDIVGGVPLYRDAAAFVREQEVAPREGDLIALAPGIYYHCDDAGADVLDGLPA